MLYLGRAPRTKETLPDFREWFRVTRHPRVFRRLTGCQRDTPGLRRHKDIYEYTCEFRKWFYDALDSNMKMTTLENTYYEKLPGKWSHYFQEEYENIRTEDVDTLGTIIESLRKRLAELCTQRYIIKGAKKS